MIPIVSTEFTQVTREQVLLELIEEELRLQALTASLKSVSYIIGADNFIPLGNHLGECVIDLLGIPRECHQEPGLLVEGDFSRDDFTESISEIISDFIDATEACDMTKEDLDKEVKCLAPKILEKYKSVAKEFHEEYPDLMLPSIISL